MLYNVMLLFSASFFNFKDHNVLFANIFEFQQIFYLNKNVFCTINDAFLSTDYPCPQTLPMLAEWHSHIAISP